jgi:signal transduction histidine kinase
MAQEPVVNPEAMHLMRQMNHDVRNSLNTLLATANMLSEGIYEPLTDRQTRAVERIERSGQRILAILDDLIAYVKAQAGEYQMSVVDFDPRTVLESVITQVKPTAEAKGLTISVETAANLPATLHGDPAVVERILLALMWNAVSFTAKGSVRVTSAWLDSWIVSVEDSGQGIPSNDVPHIFEAFWRGENPGSTVPTAGDGLGLTAAQALANLLKGQVSLKETTTKGSTFSVNLPLMASKP